MTQYILKVSSYDGMVPGARHSWGTVEGPSPKSCHGGTMYSGLGYTCIEGHELPKRVRWEVEAAWPRERTDRWIAGHFEGDGPQQFDSPKDVIDRAIVQFLDGMEGISEPADEGDELWYGWINPEPGNPMTDDDGWGKMIARCQRG